MEFSQEIKPNWQLHRLKQLSNGCSVVELSIEDIDNEFDFISVGVMYLPDSVFDKLYNSQSITRTILIKDIED